VDVCPVQCIDEFDLETSARFSEIEAGSGLTQYSHQPNPAAIALFEDGILSVNLDGCASCAACF